MPTIILRKRDDRLSLKVPVYIGSIGKSESIEITRGEITEVSDAVYNCLMNSHEADHVNLISSPPCNLPDINTKRGPGRPKREEEVAVASS